MSGYTLTETTHATNYRVATLIAAINSAESGNFAEITIRADDANVDKILLGDASMTDSRYGVSLSAGEAFTFRGVTGSNSVSTTDIYIRTVTSDAQKVHVALITN